MTERFDCNPLITPADVKPSRDDMECCAPLTPAPRPMMVRRCCSCVWPTARVQSKQVAADVPFDEDREPRTWSAKSGSTLEAKVLRTRGSRAELGTPDGRKVAIDLSALSEADREYIQSQVGSR